MEDMHFSVVSNHSISFDVKYVLLEVHTIKYY